MAHLHQKNTPLPFVLLSFFVFFVNFFDGFSLRFFFFLLLLIFRLLFSLIFLVVVVPLIDLNIAFAGIIARS
jgi:hypothetical protein